MATLERYIEPQKILPHLELKPGYRVGDFGVGGAAFFAVPLAQKVGPNGEVYMFDILKTALSGALSLTKMRGLNNCRAVWSNLEMFEGARGVGKNSLDAGLIVNVLHQSKDHEAMLAEIHRMLKVGARLLIVDWIPEATSNIAPEKVQRLSAGRTEQLGQAQGFAKLEQFVAGPYHWGVVLVKT